MEEEGGDGGSVPEPSEQVRHPGEWVGALEAKDKLGGRLGQEWEGGSGEGEKRQESQAPQLDLPAELRLPRAGSQLRSASPVSMDQRVRVVWEHLSGWQDNAAAWGEQLEKWLEEAGQRG